MGRGGTGITLGEYNQAILNPALINEYDKDDDFSFGLNVGVLASDKDKVLTSIDDIDKDIDNFESATRAGRMPSKTASEIFNSINALDEKVVRVDAGVGIMFGVPLNKFPFAVAIKNKTSIGVAADVDPGDQVVLNQIAVGAATQKDLQTTIYGAGIAITEASVIFGLPEWRGIKFGSAIKVQDAALFSLSEKINNFDNVKVNSDDIIHKKALNIDAGALYSTGENKQYTFAATLENLLPHTFKGQYDEYHIRPVITVGAGYHNPYFRAEANVDLTRRDGFSLFKDNQFLRLGMEVSAGQHAQLRLGYRKDLQGEVSNIITGGIGLSPFDRFNLDLSVNKGKGDTLGAQIQIGFKI